MPTSETAKEEKKEEPYRLGQGSQRTVDKEALPKRKAFPKSSQDSSMGSFFIQEWALHSVDLASHERVTFHVLSKLS